MTREEFSDIMGKIDERIIDSVLDVSKPEMIKVKCERPRPLRYIMGIAACIAVLVTTVIAVPYLKGILPFDDPSESAGSSVSISDKNDFVRGWDPETLVYDDPEEIRIGGNYRICNAELDGITAELILHNVKKEVLTTFENELTDFNYTYYVGAEDIVLYIHDDSGKRFIAGSVTPHLYNGMELISKDCLFEGCTRLFKTDNSEYVLMQYTDADISLLFASFYIVDTERQTRHDENGIYDASDWRVVIIGDDRAGLIGDGRVGDWQYGFHATKDFEYTEGKFRDFTYGYNMYWNGTSMIVDIDGRGENYTGFLPDAVYYEPEPKNVVNGTDTVIAEDYANGITAKLILCEVFKRSGERHYTYPDDKYLDMWAGWDLCLYVTDEYGHRVLMYITPPLGDGIVKFVPKSCSYEDGIKIIQTSEDGKDSLIIRMYLAENHDEAAATYIRCDLDKYADFPKDENDISIVRANELTYVYNIE